MKIIRIVFAIVSSALLGACSVGQTDNPENGVVAAKLIQGQFDQDLMAHHVVATDPSGNSTTTNVEDNAFQMPLSGGRDYWMSMVDANGQEYEVRFHCQKGTEYYTDHMLVASHSRGMSGHGMMSGDTMCCEHGSIDITEEKDNPGTEDNPEDEVLLEDEDIEVINLGLIRRMGNGYLEPEHSPYAMVDTDGDGENDYIDEDDDGDGIVDYEDDDINGDGHPDSFEMMGCDRSKESHCMGADMMGICTMDNTTEAGSTQHPGSNSDTGYDGGMPDNHNSNMPDNHDGGMPEGYQGNGGQWW